MPAMQRALSWRRKSPRADVTDPLPPPPLPLMPSQHLSNSQTPSSYQPQPRPPNASKRSSDSKKTHRRTLSPVLTRAFTRNRSNSVKENPPASAPHASTSFQPMHYDPLPVASGCVTGSTPPAGFDNFAPPEGPVASTSTSGFPPQCSPSTDGTLRLRTTLQTSRAERYRHTPASSTSILRSADTPIAPPAASLSFNFPQVTTEPALPSPSYPFPRMGPEQTSPSTATRPKLVSAFTTCTTIKGGRGRGRSDESVTSSCRWSDDGMEDGASVVGMGMSAPTTPPKKNGTVGSASQNPFPLPLTPPSTSPRRRPHRLDLSPDLFNSSSTVVVDQGDNRPPFFDELVLTHSFSDPFARPILDTVDTGSLSLMALETFEGSPEFPWSGTRKDGSGGVPRSPSYPDYPHSASDPTAGHEPFPSHTEEEQLRRRTMAGGELARLRNGLQDAAHALEGRDFSPKAKRSGFYVPSDDERTDDEDEGERGYSDCHSRPLSIVSSLANISYIAADNAHVAFSRLDDPYTLRSTASPTSPRPTPQSPTSTGLKKLRLSRELPPHNVSKLRWSVDRSPDSSPPLSHLPPLRRPRSSSVPTPLRVPPVPSLAIPPLPFVPSNAAAQPPWTPVSSRFSTSPSSEDSANPDLGPSFSSTTAAYAKSTAPTTSSLVAPPVPPLPAIAPLPTAVAAPLDGPVVVAAPTVEASFLRAALDREKIRTLALEEEVRRLKRVIGVLMGLPGSPDDEA